MFIWIAIYLSVHKKRPNSVTEFQSNLNFSFFSNMEKQPISSYFIGFQPSRLSFDSKKIIQCNQHREKTSLLLQSSIRIINGGARIQHLHFDRLHWIFLCINWCGCGNFSEFMHWPKLMRFTESAFFWRFWHFNTGKRAIYFGMHMLSERFTFRYARRVWPFQ